MAFWCYGKDGFCDKNMLCSELCVYFDGKGGEEREINENQTDAASDAPQWISVEDRLPEECLYVIVYLQCRYGNDKDIWHMDADCYEGDDWRRYTENGAYKVTHWMPLPEPPKEE